MRKNVTSSQEDPEPGFSQEAESVVFPVIDLLTKLIGHVFGSEVAAEVLFASCTVYLFGLESGYLVITDVNAREQDWQAMCEHLPEDLTYDPGESDFIGGYEIIYMATRRSSPGKAYAIVS